MASVCALMDHRAGDFCFDIVNHVSQNTERQEPMRLQQESYNDWVDLFLNAAALPVYVSREGGVNR